MERKKTYICVDVEAALIRGRQHIIEVGAVKWLPDGTKETFTQLIKPYKFKKLNAHIQKLTGITTEQLLDAPSFKEAIYKFKRWCKGDYILLTFGEFDRKVFEEELARNYMNSDFLFPLVDYQQKYMIVHGLKEQPSLGGLMTTLGLEVETQHRALADAESLLKIFEVTNGESVIECQQTRNMIILFTQFKQQETDFDVAVTYLNCTVENDHIEVQHIETYRELLPFTVHEEERMNKEGETYVTQLTTIQPSIKVKAFLQQIILQAEGKVVLTRSGLRSMSRLLRLHGCTMPKTENMQLSNLLNNEEILAKFYIGEQSVHAYEAKICRLLRKFEGLIIEEYSKRALLPQEILKV
ncbi:3'-5' exonuclease [Solibacillus sp. CAU 1738]|uniref:3'-5' exonuclease n=1 Tax=Solibacillus sp. CAU 1738 TaxID=3140363 RepID=UPI003261CF25